LYNGFRVCRLTTVVSSPFVSCEDDGGPHGFADRRAAGDDGEISPRT